MGSCAPCAETSAHFLRAGRLDPISQCRRDPVDADVISPPGCQRDNSFPASSSRENADAAAPTLKCYLVVWRARQVYFLEQAVHRVCPLRLWDAAERVAHATSFAP
jgi:hypothetical protein